ERFTQDHVAPGGTERGPDRTGQGLDAVHHLPARRVGEKQLFSHRRVLLESIGGNADRTGPGRPQRGGEVRPGLLPRDYLTIFARMSDSRRILISSPSSLISVPEYLPKSTSSPSTTPIGARSPESSSLPGPTARTRPRCGFSFAVSGRTIPPAVFSSASICWITTRSS